MNGISKCQNCNRFVIEEEAQNHECKSVEKYEIKRSILWVNDGSKWYPLRLKKRSNPSDENLHLEQSDGDSPEPMKDGFKYYASFLLVR